jgi:hypothetical protein
MKLKFSNYSFFVVFFLILIMAVSLSDTSFALNQEIDGISLYSGEDTIYTGKITTITLDFTKANAQQTLDSIKIKLTADENIHLIFTTVPKNGIVQFDYNFPKANDYDLDLIVNGEEKTTFKLFVRSNRATIPLFIGKIVLLILFFLLAKRILKIKKF